MEVPNSPGGSPAGSPGSSAMVSNSLCGSPNKLRDHMDDIFESRGFYRKHIPHDRSALFRAVADVICHTQQNLHRTIEIVFRYRNESNPDVMIAIDDLDLDHREVRAMAKLFNIHFNVIDHANRNIEIQIITPKTYLKSIREPLFASKCCTESDGKPKENANVSQLPSDVEDQGTCLLSRRIMLCCTSETQYDPVYKKSTIDIAGMVQSILYELLYSEVFHIPDAMAASTKMLEGVYDQLGRKPDVYDREFQGSALEALENFLIPFPYKVAKALSPEHYRNLEYDVYKNEKHHSSRLSLTFSPVRSSPRRGRTSSPKQTIGTLTKGTPVVVTTNGLENMVGRVVQPTKDRKKMQIYVPDLGCHVFVPRRDVCPIKEMDEMDQENNLGLEYFEDPDGENGVKTDQLTDDQVEQRNKNLRLRSGDPNFLSEFDFTIPPPPFFRCGPPNAITTSSSVSNRIPEYPFSASLDLPIIPNPEIPHYFQTQRTDNNGNYLHPPSPLVLCQFLPSPTPNIFGIPVLNNTPLTPHSVTIQTATGTNIFQYPSPPGTPILQTRQQFFFPDGQNFIQENVQPSYPEIEPFSVIPQPNYPNPQQSFPNANYPDTQQTYATPQPVYPDQNYPDPHANYPNALLIHTDRQPNNPDTEPNSLGVENCVPNGNPDDFNSESN